MVFESRQVFPLFDSPQQQQQPQQHQQQVQDIRSRFLPFVTMPTTISSIAAPKFSHPPFFSSVFRCPIAIGSFFIFSTPTNRKEHLVGRIVEATKSFEADHAQDHLVTVNVFIPFTSCRLIPT